MGALQPILRIVAHYVLSNLNSEELKEATLVTTQCLYLRSMYDMNSQTIFASKSLLKLAKMPGDTIFEPPIMSDFGDPTVSEIAKIST